LFLITAQLAKTTVSEQQLPDDGLFKEYTIAAAPIFEAQSIARAFSQRIPELAMPAPSGFYSFGGSGAARRTGQGRLEEPADELRLIAGSRENALRVLARRRVAATGIPGLLVIEGLPNPRFLPRNILMRARESGRRIREKNRARIGDLHKAAMESTIGQSARAWAGGDNGIIG